MPDACAVCFCGGTCCRKPFIYTLNVDYFVAKHRRTSNRRVIILGFPLIILRFLRAFIIYLIGLDYFLFETLERMRTITNIDLFLFFDLSSKYFAHFSFQNCPNRILELVLLQRVFTQGYLNLKYIHNNGMFCIIL